MSNPYRQYDELYGGLFGVNPGVLSNIGSYESGNRADAVNNWDINAKNGTPSKGRMQFIEPTFDAFFRQAAAARPRVFKGWKPNWLDPEQQTAVTAWALANGKGSHWATFDRALSEAGGRLRQKKTWLGDNKNTPSGTPPGPSVVTKSGKGQRVIPGRWVGGPDEDRLARINVAWGMTDPAMAEALAGKHVRQNQPRYIPGRVVGKPITYDVKNPANSVPMPRGSAKWYPKGTYRDQLNAIAQRFNLRFDSNAPWYSNPQKGGGSHTHGSLHYAGRAIDVGDAKNDPATLRRLAQWARANRNRISEFYYDVMPWYIQDGQIVRGRYGGHADHAHIGLA